VTHQPQAAELAQAALHDSSVAGEQEDAKKVMASECIQPAHLGKCTITAGNNTNVICGDTCERDAATRGSSLCRQMMTPYYAAAQAFPHAPSEARAHKGWNTRVTGAHDAPAEAPGRRRAHGEDRGPHGGRPERQARARS